MDEKRKAELVAKHMDTMLKYKTFEKYAKYYLRAAPMDKKLDFKEVFEEVHKPPFEVDDVKEADRLRPGDENSDLARVRSNNQKNTHRNRPRRTADNRAKQETTGDT